MIVRSFVTSALRSLTINEPNSRNGQAQQFYANRGATQVPAKF